MGISQFSTYYEYFKTDKLLAASKHTTTPDVLSGLHTYAPATSDQMIRVLSPSSET
jgi:hypothetical protein